MPLMSLVPWFDLIKRSKGANLSFLITLVLMIVEVIGTVNTSESQLVSDRLQPRRRQSQTTFLSHKQNLFTGSANSPLTSPHNQFYLSNNVNSPHNG